jgi:hypothetical protein
VDVFPKVPITRSSWKSDSRIVEENWDKEVVQTSMMAKTHTGKRPTPEGSLKSIGTMLDGPVFTNRITEREADRCNKGRCRENAKAASIDVAITAWLAMENLMTTEHKVKLRGSLFMLLSVSG